MIKNKRLSFGHFKLSNFNKSAPTLRQDESGDPPGRRLTLPTLPIMSTLQTTFANLAQHCARKVGTVRQLASLPVAHLEFDRRIEPDNVSATYLLYTKAHPKYKLIQYKSWGAALVDLQECGSREGYLERIKGKNNGAWHAKRARARGYTVAEIDRNDYIDALHEIHTSVDQRQGRPMDEKYLEKQLRFERPANFRCHGVFSAEGKLVAYATIGRYGNFSAFSQLMGYRNNDGIMHLLMSDIIGQEIDQGKVRYVMYDTFFGALPGLRQFKTVLGFQPYRARYRIQ